MKKRIAVVQGHPDSDNNHLGHALSEAYAQAAIKAGHDVRIINIGKIDFPLVRNKMEWENEPLPPQLVKPKHDLLWAEHWALFYPLWLGAMPAKLKGFLEQILRPGLAFVQSEPEQVWDQLLVNKSARVIVTMATPKLIYKHFYGAHTVKSLERNILKYCGLSPVKTTLIGDVYNKSEKQLSRSIKQMADYGAKGF